jgi:adenine-specific DNA-methyltransferase
MYFSPENAGRIDAIRGTLETWRQEGRVTDDEFYILLAALLDAVPSVSNVSGTYGAYLKFWESRSQKPLTLAVPTPCIRPGTMPAYYIWTHRITPASTRLTTISWRQ